MCVPTSVGHKRWRPFKKQSAQRMLHIVEQTSTCCTPGAIALRHMLRKHMLLGQMLGDHMLQQIERERPQVKVSIKPADMYLTLRQWGTYEHQWLVIALEFGLDFKHDPWIWYDLIGVVEQIWRQAVKDAVSGHRLVQSQAKRVSHR